MLDLVAPRAAQRLPAEPREGKQVVAIVRAEDVLAIEAAGGVAVCSAMGAGKAHLADWSALRGKDVRAVQDKDDAGRKHATQVFEITHKIGPTPSRKKLEIGHVHHT